MTKNIIEVYLQQKCQFIIILSGLPTANVDKFAKILGNDLEFTVIFMKNYLINKSDPSNITNYDVNKLDTDIRKTKTKGVIISSLIFPKDIVKHYIDIHLNLNIYK